MIRNNVQCKVVSCRCCCSFLCCHKCMTVLVSAFRSRLSSSALRSPLVFSPCLEQSCGYRLPPSPGWFSRLFAGFYPEAEVISVRVASLALPVRSMHGWADVA